MMGPGEQDTNSIREHDFSMSEWKEPHAHTSGVSAGQIIPQSVLCSCLGLASLPSLPIGLLSRLRCERVEANVSLFNTCR